MDLEVNTKMERMIGKADYDRYKKSGCWKCEKSPTTAHHWIILGNLHRCRYCGETKVDGTNEAGLTQQELDLVAKFRKNNRVEAQQQRRKREKDQKEDE